MVSLQKTILFSVSNQPRHPIYFSPAVSASHPRQKYIIYAVSQQQTLSARLRLGVTLQVCVHPGIYILPLIRHGLSPKVGCVSCDARLERKLHIPDGSSLMESAGGLGIAPGLLHKK